MSFDNNKLCVHNVCNNFSGYGLNVTEIATIDSPYTAGLDDVIILADASAGPITINLQDNHILPNQKYVIKKVDSTLNAVTVIPPSGQTIDGAATYDMLRENEVTKFVHNGADWAVINEKLNRILADKGDLFVFDGTVLRKLPRGFDGQFLQTDSSSALGLRWVNIGGGGGSSNISYSIGTLAMEATSVSWTAVGYFSWLNARYSTYTTGTFLFSATVNNRDLNVRLRDVTNGVTLGSLSVAANGFYSFSVINPGTDAQIEMQIQKSAAAGINPIISGAALEYTVPAGGVIAYMLLSHRADAINLTFDTIAYFPWTSARYGGYSAGIVVFNIIYVNRAIEVRLRDVTNGVNLGSAIIATSGVTSFSVANPASDARIELQIRKTVAAGINPSILGASLEFSV